ncbi:MAG: Rpp14/Pop5 family protein [Candidatus Bathyarchaeia archaeon]
MKKKSWRYLLIKIIGGGYSNGEFTTALTDTLRTYFGSVNSFKINPKIVRYEPSIGEAVLKCQNDSVNIVRSAITLLTHIGDNPAAAFVIKSSGTIRSLAEIGRRRKFRADR